MLPCQFAVGLYREIPNVRAEGLAFLHIVSSRSALVCPLLGNRYNVWRRCVGSDTRVCAMELSCAFASCIRIFTTVALELGGEPVLLLACMQLINHLVSFEGFRASYQRIPLSRERTPEAVDIEQVHAQVCLPTELYPSLCQKS